jgi:hypothetical protein
MMNYNKAWPEEAIKHIQVIAKEQEELSNIIGTCIYLVRNRAGHRVEPFVPDIETKALEVERQAMVIQKMDIRPAGGRTPRWSDAALEIRLLAAKLVKATDYIRDNLPGNRFKSVMHLLKLQREINNKIFAELNAVPMPPDLVDIFQEVDSILSEEFGD